jgi:hypothetical protein
MEEEGERVMKEDEKRFFRACFRCGHFVDSEDLIEAIKIMGQYPVGREPWRGWNTNHGPKVHLDYYISPRDIVNLFEGYIHHKRCWYYLSKWSALGFYEYGTTMDLGWFYPDKLPERYRNLFKEDV